ncbi:hypothetical protein QBC46DRAFT_348400 [Diplogelasinospora grovesii]|uniref:Cellobiose dehydrogenase-like cytochrome domain-containing protein n=1 Tax=Diplogelasinospora grovesii TaxID=303347 RepID=A0AAN6MV86_9PEZI|nr:hypothetical protein QBC46DRAFT_348400 [Diplogelasinospora grovesii]
MGPKNLLLLALASTQAWTSSASDTRPDKRQDTTHKYCPGGTSICFSEYTVATHNITFRIAIPDVPAAPFDILLQIIAPVASTGWAGLAWGGKMSSNPLTIGWPNGNSAVVSSRYTSGHSVPGAYTGATYSILPSSTTNATHWQLDVLCVGCSQWGATSLNPNGTNALAWAKSSKAVSTPASNASSFAIHEAKAVFAHDFSQARIPQGVFDALAYDLANQAASSAPPPTTTTAAAAETSAGKATSTKPAVTVTTGVTQLPKPVPSKATSSVVPPPRPSVSTTFTTAITVTITNAPTSTSPADDGGGAAAWPTVVPWRGPPFGKGKGPPFRHPPAAVSPPTP